MERESSSDSVILFTDNPSPLAEKEAAKAKRIAVMDFIIFNSI
jgi:hypothetical protein